MKPLREAYSYHMYRAQIASMYHAGRHEVVVRKYPGDRASTSIVGGAVSRAIYERWMRAGVRWRVVAVWEGGKRAQVSE